MAIYHTYDHGIIRVKVPVPFPLQYVNSYILQGSKGITILDPGLHTDAAEEVWKSVLQELGIAPQQIKRVVLTHHHPDHYGLAGWMQELTGCEVFMSAAARESAERLWGESETMTELLSALFTEHGLPTDKQGQMKEHMRGFIPLVSPHPTVKFLAEGDVWHAGDLSFQTITVSGHAYQHLVFIDERRRLMFCGDHVLPRITPNISYLPGEDRDPLHSFLQGLDRLTAWEVDTVFLGHRDPFHHLQQRIAEIEQHHEQRLQQLTDLLVTPQTAYELCLTLFGDKLSIHQLRFAMSEIIAHLIYLEKRGYISSKPRTSDGASVQVYMKINAYGVK